MTTQNQWFIVIGRMHGQDEATALPIAAPDRAAAIADYIATMRSDAGLEDDAQPDEEGEGYVYLDAIFACGLERPREV
jgi:hypothetical protein